MADGPLAWLDEALCAEVGGDVFYVDPGGKSVYAKRICLQCPVRARCLDWALENHEEDGIWGRLSAAERRKVARERRAA